MPGAPGVRHKEQQVISAISDTILSKLIRDAGISSAPAELRALLAGINAAPPGPDPDAWLTLVAPKAPLDIADRLRRGAITFRLCKPATRRPAGSYQPSS